MKIEREDIAPEAYQAIASAVLEMLKPMLARTGKPADDMIFDVQGLAEFLKTSKGQIYQWVNSSQHGLSTFPYYKAGKQLRFSKAEILAWMKSNTKRLEDR
ncbi:MAG: helix-turn-helix domain-containing protein [Actinomycetota bacterium]|nr:helix-turn-helix domain-containing protein [Actinomycetota bacterium]